MLDSFLIVHKKLTDPPRDNPENEVHENFKGWHLLVF